MENITTIQFLNGEKDKMVYDIPVNFVVSSTTEEEAERQLLTFLKLAMLDHESTYNIKGFNLVEFIAEESGDI